MEIVLFFNFKKPNFREIFKYFILFIDLADDRSEKNLVAEAKTKRGCAFCTKKTNGKKTGTGMTTGT